MHAGISTTSLIQPATATAPPHTTCAVPLITATAPNGTTVPISIPSGCSVSQSVIEPMTPGHALEATANKFQSLAQIMLPSEKRRMTLANRPISPINLLHLPPTHTAPSTNLPNNAIAAGTTKPSQTEGSKAIKGVGGDFVIHSSIPSEGEQWYAAHSFDVHLKERELQSTRAVSKCRKQGIEEENTCGYIYHILACMQNNIRIPA